MKKLLTTTLVSSVFAIALVAGFAACGGSMANLKNSAADQACESSCDEAKDKCLKECAGETEEGEAKDNAACELGCDEARDKCANDCKEKH